MSLVLVASALIMVAPATSPASAVTSAGSIVFIKNHNVWVSRPDGSGQGALTSTGTSAASWRSPEQSDVGTVVATRGTRVVRMNQWGTELNSFDPSDLRNSGGEWIGGAMTHVTISPDGSKVTYTYGRDHPTWLTNSRLLVNGIGYDQMYLFDIGRGQKYWFDEGMYSGIDFKYLSDGAISRNGKFMAVVRGTFEDARIATLSVNGDVLTGGRPPLPDHVCETTPQAGFSSQTFAPDSSAVAWEEPDGIWIKGDVLDCTVQPALTIGAAKHRSCDQRSDQVGLQDQEE